MVLIIKTSIDLMNYFHFFNRLNRLKKRWYKIFCEELTNKKLIKQIIFN